MQQAVLDFLGKHHRAAMVTLRKDGSPHVVMVGVGLVDGRLWSSGTQTRLRTSHLRHDSRAGLMVMDSRNAQSWLGLDTRVTILEGDDAPELNLRLYRVIAGRDPDDLDEYLEAMVEEKRLIYEFEVVRTYGQY